MNRTEKPSVQKLLRAAKSLFFRFGIRKVSVAEICMEAGVSKMTFYRHFKNRDDIAIQVLGNHFTKRMETIELILQENIPFEKKLKKITAKKMEWFKSAGSEIIRELMSDRESPPGKFLGGMLDGQARRTKEIFVALQKKGELRKDIKVDLIMHIVENLWKAFADENLMKIYDDRSQLYEELYKTTYYGILPLKRKQSRR
jgi:AcrR family transcriptional regulator